LQSTEHHTRYRPVVANGASEYKLYALLDAAIKYPAFDQPLVYGLSNPAGLANRVDGPKVMFVSLAGTNGFVQVNAQGCSVKSRLDIMDGEAVSVEQNLHIVVLDEINKMPRRARMYQPGSGDN